MIKHSLLRVRSAFESFCLKNVISSDKVDTGPGLTAFVIPQEHAETAQKFLTESARQAALQLKAADLPAGRLLVLASGTLSETAMADLADDAVGPDLLGKPAQMIVTEVKLLQVAQLPDLLGKLSDSLSAQIELSSLLPRGFLDDG